MKLSSLFGLTYLTTSTAAAFVGLGGHWYYPECAAACRASIASAPLACSDHGHGGGHSHGASPTSPDCRASDTPFLTTLAYCFSQNCESVPVWRLEKFWASETTGAPSVPPKWGYIEALGHVTSAPNATYESGATLEDTLLVDPEAYGLQHRFMVVFEYISKNESIYAVTLLVIGFATPILFTLASKLPYMTGLFDKLKPYIVYPSVLGTYQVRPLPWLLGNAPTAGQALYIAMFFILNIALSIVGYKSSQPHPWGYDKRGEILAYAGYRTGHFAFAFLPLVILFSGRNNILLWLTNWSHSTFLLLHRWVARIFALHTILHSLFLLVAYKRSDSYSMDSKLPYWHWGIVGTVFVCAMLVFSMLWFRRFAYEVFLISHIIMAVFVIVGCWYHYYLRFTFRGSYQYWIYAACAVWFFDRLMRVLRIAKNGMRRATVTEVGAEHVRVDIPGLRWTAKPGHHAYLYFPTLNPLRPWENHPFSVNSTALFHTHKHSLASLGGSDHRSSDEGRDVEKSGSTAIATTQSHASHSITGTAGVTLFIRKSTGLTKLLQRHASLFTLIEGPYPNNPTDAILKCDRVLLIGGGIGITGLMGWLNAHPNVKIAWSIKESAQAVVEELDVVLKGVADKHISIGERLDVHRLLMQEVSAGWQKIGVVVCGPGGLCDGVRAEVSRLGRSQKVTFELEVDAYSW